MNDPTTASTYHGPAITLEGIRRALAALEGLPEINDTPIRLTQKEVDRLVDLLGLQMRPRAEPGPSSLMGIPVMVLPEGSPITRLFSLYQRIERSHPLLRTMRLP
jgi:hypothetical protein